MNYKLWLPIALVAAALTSSVNVGSHEFANTPATVAQAPAAKAPAQTGASNKKIVCTYLVYKGFGPEKDLTSYDQYLIAPDACGGHDVICFWRICDDDGIITVPEFEAAFEAMDLVDSGNDLLSDEEEIIGELEKFTLSK